MDRQMKTGDGGSFVSMFASPLAAFEGAETILFMSGSFQITTVNLLGIASLIAVLHHHCVAMTKASRFIQPHRIFFILTWLIYALA